MLREGRLYRAPAVAALHSLADRTVNYAPVTGSRVPTWNARWHIDYLRQPLAREPAGDPVRGGAWDIACRLVRDYQFAEPSILRALYRGDMPLLGRDMLLEGRFAGLRFDMGVRVTSVIDETHGSGAAESRVWGWAYRTLQGHLEQGELAYQVVKRLRTGTVEFRITGHSRRAPLPNPVVRTGFAVFGRWTQHRFYHASARRLRRLLRAELEGAPPLAAAALPGYDNVVLAPTPRR
ncbi:DUF1990 family protein [Streptomyces qinglanensis]|uniref:DUF1990 domain-containing protein n=1 Tax=Streptomyces qinglanensis TaxID=943816 RepID=A0A1H9R3W7_9ACTN|nr:DUF1990 family protein [Streptomyces qinglanensis]SER67398.1 protein of unknown function [Streptomyces qinglanensis]